MPVRMIQPEELLECEKIQSIAFVASMDTAQAEKRIAEEPAPADPYIGHFNDQGVLTACMELPEYQMYYEGEPVKMVGIGGVASLPEHRFGGAIRQIFQAAFPRMLESGAVFTSLYPFSHPYYRQFGYELCQTSPEYDLPITLLSKFRYEGKARMLRTGDPIDGLKAVFDAQLPRYNMAVRREARHWEKLLGKDSLKERVYTYLLEDGSGPIGYMVLAAQDSGEFRKAACLREIAFTRPQGLADLLGFLSRFSAQYERVRIPLPDDIPLPALVEESYQLKVSYDNQQMTRVINVQKALERKRHFDGAAYTLQVRDALIPENDGTFRVTCQGGVPSVQRVAGAADLTLDVRTLTQLLLGYLSMDEALYKSDVQVSGNQETLRRVFVKRPVFLTEHF